ncbi:CDP-alcohol phosphatidyltransferase family protein [Muribaculum intestinale]|uniref:CDP-alcohol phosphatidyltransferase n=1 Tax=Muribaculum intestinale TaxID=1796646 RepID=A0A1B1SD37_9BACT|nr:CDP-alcohol phosphatidyltransferase family protein [Muribaculum intestinale]ANU64707.1 CDP-alcohol phosphatidyltransferase [Muribaculum intestinale]ASB38999.1 CDP-alcohol phosphatidyltransferase [Muribaculum intestinale]PWB04726.1 CDP-alcohol phosphatidyltransferase [Muribaculum intestinale]PWB11418.1 CDP-alcohol phosphatidyltransferase [Muribaculum intestinale]QQR10021.1 CDP-alcohol phosphatidyltransferase family protein [Muribaculum intestinale]
MANNNTAARPTAKVSYRDTLKSMDTEEHIDLAFYRPIGYMWACLAKRLGVTPNAITIASIFLGIGAGIMFYFPDMWLNVIGMLLLIWANSFDSADGQLARMTKQYSRLGRILDGLSGDLWFASIYIAICLRENITSEFFSAHPWVIWVVAVVTGLCHAKQAAAADYYRQFHLYFLKGEEGSELESCDELRSRLATLSWSKNFWKKLTLTFYTQYTANQEALTPSMQTLRRELRKRFASGVIPMDFREAFRAKSLPLMKYTNILSFNWRVIALFTALFLQMPWLYFAFELIVLNALLVYMIVRHEHICRDFTKELKDGKY